MLTAQSDDETLTYWSAGLGEEITVETERRQGEPREWTPEQFQAFAARIGAAFGIPGYASAGLDSMTRALIELERNAVNLAVQISNDLEPGFRALRLALAIKPSVKAQRRLRRAELRRVHRDYIQRKRSSHLGYGVVTVSLPIYDEAATLPTHDTEAS